MRQSIADLTRMKSAMHPISVFPAPVHAPAGRPSAQVSNAIVNTRHRDKMVLAASDLVLDKDYRKAVIRL